MALGLMKKLGKSYSENRSYAFNRSIIPFSRANAEKVKPPHFEDAEDTTNMFPEEKKPSKEKVIQEYMDNYRKAERALIVNFYTGGNAYKKGIMDAIYKGINPLTV